MQRENMRTQQAERMKATILDAAIPLFARGFESVSVQQIASAAGVKHSLVMYHFGTKEQLWEQAASRLMQQFDQLHLEYLGRMPPPQTERAMVYNPLLAFVQALRDLPQYGQMLLSEASQETDRLQWLHQNFFPSVVRQTPLQEKRILEVMLHTTLVRSVVAGAMLFSVVAAPQLAKSATLEGGEAPEDIYPMSDRMAERLAQMLTDFLFSQIDGFQAGQENTGDK